MLDLLPALLAICCGLVGLGFYLLWKYPWLVKDYQALKPLMKAQIRIMSNLRKNKLYIDEFDEKVKKFGEKTALLFEDEKYSFSELNSRANQVAHASLKLGVKPKDVLCILIANEPTFIWTYIGLAKIGVQTAFLNFNLRAKSLLHSFTVSEAKTLIIGKDKELVEAVQEIYNELNNNVTIYVWDDQENIPIEFKSFKKVFQDSSSSDLDQNYRKDVKASDPLCFIYTSGTTGLPKAAIISQSKALKGSSLLGTVGTTHNDVVYTPLPLYHTAGNVVAFGATILEGSTLVLRRKFSASNFFSDCVKYKVTVIQYIGELCRYLLASPPSPYDKAHCIKLAFGNGLRRDIWEQFQERFSIPNIVEFYGATEGNMGFLNMHNKPGSVGRASPVLVKIGQLAFVKYDFDTAEPVRNDSGFCIRADTDEAGLLLTPITKFLAFDGYKGQADLSNKKIIRDVFKKGDLFFNSGDLFIRDNEYNLFFADRIGDTFRWKGENVSTVEVANAVAELSWIEDANVFGVSIPGQDGRAGMTAITPVAQHKLTMENLEELFQHCKKSLPFYAIPRFVRVQQGMEMTSTFKQLKVDLVNEGFDPSNVKNADLYYLNIAAKTYQPLTGEIHKAISKGTVKV